jgi:hypothetical protein
MWEIMRNGKLRLRSNSRASLTTGLLSPPSPIPKRRLTGRLSLRDEGDPCTAAVSRRVSVVVFPGVWLSLVRTGIVGSAAPDETLMLA